MQHLNVRPLSTLPQLSPAAQQAMTVFAADVEDLRATLDSMTGNEVGLVQFLQFLRTNGILEQSIPHLSSLFIPIVALPRGITLEPHRDLIHLWSALPEDQFDLLSLHGEYHLGPAFRRVLCLVKSTVAYNKAMAMTRDERYTTSENMRNPNHYHALLERSALGFLECDEWESAAYAIRAMEVPRYLGRNSGHLADRMVLGNDPERARRVISECMPTDRYQNEVYRTLQGASRERDFMRGAAEAEAGAARAAEVAAQAAVPVVEEPAFEPQAAEPLSAVAATDRVAPSEEVPAEGSIIAAVNLEEQPSVGARFVQKIKDFGSWMTDCFQSFIDWLRRCTSSTNSNV